MELPLGILEIVSMVDGLGWVTFDDLDEHSILFVGSNRKSWGIRGDSTHVSSCIYWVSSSIILSANVNSSTTSLITKQGQRRSE